MHSVRIEGGPDYRCEAEDTLLRAGLRAGLGMPYECNAGSCGTCKVELLEGQITSLRPDAPGLGERDRAKNRVLACQARPGTDCRIKVRLRPENVPLHRPARFRATLTGVRDLTHDMREFTFSAKDSPGFLPGQYALFYLPGLAAARTYSMSNIDDGSGRWQFIVRRVPGGTGTVTLFDKVAVGDEIMLDGPYGLAYLRPESPRDLVLIGGGSGLAPMLSLARGAVAPPGARSMSSTARAPLATCAAPPSSRRCPASAPASPSRRCSRITARIPSRPGTGRRVSCTRSRAISWRRDGPTSSTTSPARRPWPRPCRRC
jgi:toluene monooxygenase electron transfer component